MVSAPEQFAHGNLDTTSTSLVGWFLPRNAWLNSGYMFLYIFCRLLDVFPTFSTYWVYSDPAIDSRPAFRGVLSLGIESTV